MKETNLISKWLNGEITPGEMAALKKMPEYRDYKEIAENSSRFRGPAFDEKESFERLKQRISFRKSGKVRKLNYAGIYKIAAVLLVLIVSGWYVWYNSPQAVSTGNSEIGHVELPDASEVRLNADSKITYNSRTWESSREVNLYGEAFFEVEKGSSFKVETTQGTVQVLGTKFNVKNRPGYFDVHCYEGAVKVVYSGMETILKPGEYLKVIEDRLMTGKAAAAEVPGWVLNESRFEAVPLKYVINEIERQFDLKIQSENVDLNQLFTGSFSHSDEETALKSITVPLQLKYRMEGSRKVILYEE